MNTLYVIALLKTSMDPNLRTKTRLKMIPKVLRRWVLFPLWAPSPVHLLLFPLALFSGIRTASSLTTWKALHMTLHLTKASDPSAVLVFHWASDLLYFLICLCGGMEAGSMRAEFLSILFTADPSRPGTEPGGQWTLSQHPKIKIVKKRDVSFDTFSLSSSHSLPISENRLLTFHWSQALFPALNTNLHI